jgi:acyl-CoA thioesterase-1
MACSLLLAALGSAALLTSGAEKPTPHIRVACVGDSITAGSGIMNSAMAYPAQLGRLLGEPWQVQNFGVNGATLLKHGDKPYDQQKAYTAALDSKPDVLILMLGTNDSKPQNWVHKEDFAADCSALLDAFRKANPRIRIYVCLPVPAFPGNYNIRDEVIRNEILPVLRIVAQEKQVPIIDCYAALNGKSDLFPDKVHPNAEGAGVIAETVAYALTGKKPAPASAAK